MLRLKADRIRKREATASKAREQRNARLAFVAGSLVAWGSALAGLHATLKATYAPGALQLANADKFGAEPMLVDFSAAHFNLLALLVAIGAAAVVLATVYLILHGAALAHGSLAESPHRAATERFLFDCFVVLFWLAVLTLLLSPLLYAGVWLDRYFVETLSLSVPWANNLRRVVLGGAILAILVLVVPRLYRAYERRNVPAEVFRHWYAAYMMAAVLVAACTFVAVDSAYVVELGNAKAVYAKSKDSFVELQVTLTGSASDVAAASLEIRSRTDAARRLDVRPDLEVGEGRLLALVPLERLTPGAYDAVLVSTRDSWLGSDLWSWTVRRRVEFRVLP